MAKVVKKFSQSAQERRGSGQLTWSQFQAMLRMAGMLRGGQRLEKVEVTEDGFKFTTNKTGGQK